MRMYALEGEVMVGCRDLYVEVPDHVKKVTRIDDILYFYDHKDTLIKEYKVKRHQSIIIMHDD